MTLTMSQLARAPGLDRPRLLNLGCGARFHDAWINVDLQPIDNAVRRHDVGRRLPFPDQHFSAVYHSHLLEHLPPPAALALIQECFRVLQPGGTLRIAVPDLEDIARLYLEALDHAWLEDPEATQRHAWLVMELYDQTTREQPGGRMLQHMNHAGAYAWQRLGADAVALRRHLQRRSAPPTWRQRLRGWLLGSWRERLVRRLLGAEYALLQLGRFRRSGEVHQWMYDRVSLRALVREAGFAAFRCVGPRESAIAGWDSYGLDVSQDGRPAKPDSLYAEATRP